MIIHSKIIWPFSDILSDPSLSKVFVQGGDQPPLPPTPSGGGAEHQANGHGNHHQQRHNQQEEEMEEDDIFTGPPSQPVEHTKPLDYTKLNR